MAVKNLVLDMGNVLLSWEPETFALRAAGNKEDAEILSRALFLTPEWAMIDEGQIDEPELLRISLQRTPERLRGTLRMLFDHWISWMAPIPGAEDFTKRAMEAGLKLYLLSNASKRFPGVLEIRPFYARLDGMMVSAHENVAKPDPRIYRLLCERYSLNPEECLFVDDLTANVKGAEAIGMHAVLFEGNYQKVEDRLRELGIAM